MHERASGLDLGWDRSFFVDEDCVGLGLSRGLPFNFLIFREKRVFGVSKSEVPKK